MGWAGVGWGCCRAAAGEARLAARALCCPMPFKRIRKNQGNCVYTGVAPHMQMCVLQVHPEEREEALAGQSGEEARRR